MRMKGKGLISLFLIVEVDDQHAQNAIISKYLDFNQHLHC